MFNFLRTRHPVSHNGCTFLHSRQQCWRVSVSPRPHQHLLFPVWGDFLFWSLLMAILMGVRWCLRVVLTCVYLHYFADINTQKSSEMIRTKD